MELTPPSPTLLGGNHDRFREVSQWEVGSARVALAKASALAGGSDDVCRSHDQLYLGAAAAAWRSSRIGHMTHRITTISSNRRKKKGKKTLNLCWSGWFWLCVRFIDKASFLMETRPTVVYMFAYKRKRHQHYARTPGCAEWMTGLSLMALNHSAWMREKQTDHAKQERLC